MTWEERRLFFNRIYWLFIILKILSTIWWILKCFPRGKQNIFLFGHYCIYFFVGKVPNPMNILITNTDQLARELEFLCINKHSEGSWNSSNYFIFGIVKLLKRGRQISSDECVSPLSALSVLALFPIRTLTPLSPTGWHTCCSTTRIVEWCWTKIYQACSHRFVKKITLYLSVKTEFH